MGRIILPNRPNIFHAHIACEGIFHLEVRKASTNKVVRELRFKNLITDDGLDYMYSAPAFAYGWGYFMAACDVGTGNTTPQTYDQALSNYLASAGNLNGTDGYSSTSYVAASSPTPAYWSLVCKYQFSTGVAAGNLAEIAIRPYGVSVGAGLFSRALIVDGSGNPTTITVLSDEILTVTYELRYYLDTSDHAFTVNLNGSPLTGTYRLYSIGSAPGANRTFRNSGNGDYTCYAYSGDIGTVTAAPTGSSTFITPSVYSFVNDISNSGTCYMDLSGTFGTGVANYGGGILALSFKGHAFQFQFGNFSSPILKVSGQQFKVAFRCSWGRYSP